MYFRAPGGNEVTIKRLDKGAFILPAKAEPGAPYVVMRPAMLARLFRSRRSRELDRDLPTAVDRIDDEKGLRYGSNGQQFVCHNDVIRFGQRIAESDVDAKTGNSNCRRPAKV